MRYLFTEYMKPKRERIKDKIALFLMDRRSRFNMKVFRKSETRTVANPTRTTQCTDSFRNLRDF